MAEQFKVGDVVRLKSGSPRMTVINVRGDEVTTEWFDVGENKLKNHTFSPDALILVEDEASGDNNHSS
ncbi:MAG: YodC family protein [Pseudohongiellaceae bacterium]